MKLEQFGKLFAEIWLKSAKHLFGNVQSHHVSTHCLFPVQIICILFKKKVSRLVRQLALWRGILKGFYLKPFVRKGKPGLPDGTMWHDGTNIYVLVYFISYCLCTFLNILILQIFRYWNLHYSRRVGHSGLVIWLAPLSYTSRVGNLIPAPNTCLEWSSVVPMPLGFSLGTPVFSLIGWFASLICLNMWMFVGEDALLWTGLLSRVKPAVCL